MINEEQLRGRWVTCELNHEQGCAHWHFEKCDCDCHALLQAELNWLTEQIERLQEAYGEDGKPALVIIESLEGCVEQRPALQEVLATLIERKKEVESKLDANK